MNLLRAFGLFWYDFLVGDSWLVAAYVAVTVGAVCVLAAQGALPGSAVSVGGSIAGTVLLSACFVLGTRHDARRIRDRHDGHR